MRDKLDWHASAAREAGQPEEQGFVHIACFLHWLAARGWLEPRIFSKEDHARIADGSIGLGELIDLTDLQLASEMATTEGAAFGQARYDAYLEAWGSVFADVGDYAVIWADETRIVARRILDDLYASWVAEGAPKPVIDDGPARHDHPEIEHLVPDRIGDQLLKVESFTLRGWGIDADHPALRGVDASATAIAMASHRFYRTSADAMGALVAVVPGRSATQLAAATDARPLFGGGPSGTRIIDGLEIQLGRLDDRATAWWCRDGRIAQVFARTQKRALAVVSLLDATMVRDAVVEALPPEPEPSEDEFESAFADLLPHEDPELEARLPSGGPWSIPSSIPMDAEFVAGMFGLEGVQGAVMAWAMGAPGVMCRLIRLPGVPVTAIATTLDRPPEVPPRTRSSERVIDGRTIAWFSAHLRTAATWTADDLLCSVGGRADDATIEGLVRRMP